MKILKYKKLKDDLYELEIDNNKKYIIHEELILKYDLLLKQEISEKQLINIQSENDMYIGYNKAIKFLAVKMRSKKEVKKYLGKIGITNSIIDEITNKIESQNYINDKEYARAYVSDRINLSMDGPKKIVSYLKENDIEEWIIQESIKLFTDEIQTEKIEKLINKEINSNSNKGLKLLKQKIYNDLINKGYSSNLISVCLENIDYDDSDIYKKEYDKLYNKLSSKYSGSELEYRIKQKLYQKGF